MYSVFHIYYLHAKSEIDEREKNTFYFLYVVFTADQQLVQYISNGSRPKEKCDLSTQQFTQSQIGICQIIILMLFNQFYKQNNMVVGEI